MAAPNVARQAAKRLRTIQRRADAAAPRAAVRALSQAGETAVKLTLTQRTHKEGTPTPSPAGQPPALVSGNMRRSLIRVPAQAAGGGIAAQALTCYVKYGSVHEFGPVTIRSHGNYPLRNRKTGQVFGQEVTIPRRPWMRPAMEKLAASGMATRVCATAFAKTVFR